MLSHPLKLAFISIIAGITGTFVGISPSLAESAIVLTGAGATFPNPLYLRWGIDFNKAHPSTLMSYDLVGSGAGIKRFLEEEIDFGATDNLLTTEQKAKYPARRGQPIQIPTTGRIIVLSYNLPGISRLRLARSTYCGILLGQVRRWRDTRILKDNPGVKLPNLQITFVHRSDASYINLGFTQHLKKACPGWSGGSGKTIEWFGGTGAKGNEGVVVSIQQGQGAIGYLDYPYAKDNGLPVATLQNKAGRFIKPSPQAASLALQSLTKTQDFSTSTADPEQTFAYPIVAPTYLLLYGQYDSAAKANALKQFIQWALAKGQRSTIELGYAPLPPNVSAQVIKAVNRINAK